MPSFSHGCACGIRESARRLNLLLVNFDRAESAQIATRLVDYDPRVVDDALLRGKFLLSPVPRPQTAGAGGNY